MFRNVGTITAAVNESQWQALVNDRHELSCTDRIEYVNPFTQEASNMTFAGEMADVTIDGKQIGALRWFRMDEQEIGVFGTGDDMVEYARKLAKVLKGTFEP